MIVKDKRVLNRLSKVYGFQYDQDHRYVTDSGNLESSLRAKKELQKAGFDLKYFDGCFYPFIVTRGNQ